MQEKESEVRRRRLWEENRRRQRNTGMITPAIHPRYGRLYRELYPDGLEQSAGNGAEDLDKKENSRGSIYYQIDPVHFSVSCVSLCQSEQCRTSRDKQP